MIIYWKNVGSSGQFQAQVLKIILGGKVCPRPGIFYDGPFSCQVILDVHVAMSSLLYSGVITTLALFLKCLSTSWQRQLKQNYFGLII